MRQGIVNGLEVPPRYFNPLTGAPHRLCFVRFGAHTIPTATLTKLPWRGFSWDTIGVGPLLDGDFGVYDFKLPSWARWIRGCLQYQCTSTGALNGRREIHLRAMRSDGTYRQLARNDGRGRDSGDAHIDFLARVSSEDLISLWMLQNDGADRTCADTRGNLELIG